MTMQTFLKLVIMTNEKKKLSLLKAQLNAVDLNIMPILTVRY